VTNSDLQIRTARREDRQDVVEVFATGMIDNPLHVAAYGSDPERRVRVHRRLVSAGLDLMDRIDLLCLEAQGRLVGAAGMTRPGACRPTRGQRVAMIPTLASIGPATAGRVTRWLSAWSAHDPDDAHCHIGPVAIRSECQGRGLGTRLMQQVTHRLDRLEMSGYLETDRFENVRFYERQGFEVVGQAEVLGVTNWFMLRPVGPRC
jgi:ribosomal protein S18 acetylase RimI-like enzyme